MGYACPVCETPQRDAEHLANHLAFVAMLHDDAHRRWLDDNAPGWADEDPAALGDRVAPQAPTATYEEVFEDTAAGADPGRPFADETEAVDSPSRASVPDDALDEAARATLAEAREMTRRMRGEPAEGGETAASGDPDEGATGDEAAEPDAGSRPDASADGGAGPDEKA